LQVSVGLLFGALFLWLALRQVALEDLLTAVRTAHVGWVLGGLGVILLTQIAKAWRWQLLYYPSWPPPSYRGLFQAMVLGQFVNLVVRLGELARIYAVDQDTPGIKARTLGTLVVEKTLDLVLLAFLGVTIVPLMVMPAFVRSALPTLVGLTAAAAVVLYIVASRAGFVLRLFERATRLLPHAIEERLNRLARAGLLGLSALRSHRQLALLLLISAGIAGLGVLTPLVLFPAFGLPFGLREAVVLHTLLSIGTTPPSTPGKVGVFEWIAIWLLLNMFGLENEAVALSYALVFHIVVILPQLGLGAVAALRFRWQDLFRPLVPPTKSSGQSNS
jgi:uncharacterized membrane protein YbhN (UPF0104 family)